MLAYLFHLKNKKKKMLFYINFQLIYLSLFYIETKIEDSKNTDYLPYQRQLHSPTTFTYNPTAGQKSPFNMTKTVQRLVDSLETDLANKMKRRPSGQFDSCIVND